MTKVMFIQLAAGLFFGGALGAGFGLPALTGAAARCKRRLAPCTRHGQCCGRKARCATSHLNGSNTCCGGEGAPCTMDGTCCIQYLCEGGICRRPAPMP